LCDFKWWRPAVPVNLDDVNLENSPVDFKFGYRLAVPARWSLRSTESDQFQSSR
jgi:hypothetical protein